MRRQQPLSQMDGFGAKFGQRIVERPQFLFPFALLLSLFQEHALLCYGSLPLFLKQLRQAKKACSIPFSLLLQRPAVSHGPYHGVLWQE
jgi:hypothetical protein